MEIALFFIYIFCSLDFPRDTLLFSVLIRPALGRPMNPNYNQLSIINYLFAQSMQLREHIEKTLNRTARLRNETLTNFH